MERENILGPEEVVLDPVLESTEMLAPEMASAVPENVAERFGEAMLHNMEIADARLDIEGKSRLGESWDKAVSWAKEGWEWAKRPSETYTEAVGKAVIFSAGTTVFLAPIFLYRNCKQVYDARKEDMWEGGGLSVAHT